MKIEDVMLSEEEESFIPPTVVLEYYRDKTKIAVEAVNNLTLLSTALLALLSFLIVLWII